MESHHHDYYWFFKNSGLTDQEINLVLDSTNRTCARLCKILSFRDVAFQERLFLVAKANPNKIPLTSLCPEGDTVAYYGRNTLPVLSRFQKVFHHPPGSDVLWGYNKQWTGFVTGPGYFSVSVNFDGVLNFDYAKLPQAKFHGFPSPRGNDSGVGKLVYGGLVDDVVGVTDDFWIGRAMKGHAVIGYFILVKK